MEMTGGNTMGEKAMMIVIALIAGVAGGVGYRLTSDGPASSAQATHEQELAEIKSRLADVQEKLKTLGEVGPGKTFNPQAVIRKLDKVEKQISKLNEKTAVLPAEPLEGEMSNQELFAAMKEFRQKERAAIREENYNREIEGDEREENENEKESEEIVIEEYEEQIIKGVAKLAVMLSLTPEQIHQMRKVGDEFLEKLREAKMLAEENDDPAYAVRMSKEFERAVVRRIGLEILTPEQLDKWRERSDDIRRALPRGE